MPAFEVKNSPEDLLDKPNLWLLTVRRWAACLRKNRSEFMLL